MKNKLLVGLMLVLVSCSAMAEIIAQCSNQSGKSYYPLVGMMDKSRAGWTDDGITGGLVTLSKLGKDDYDILFIDAYKQVISSKQDGAKVMMLSHGHNDVSFLIVYMGKTAEIYTFLVDKVGKAEFIQTTSRGGDDVLFPKASLFRGNCQFVNLKALD
jgi:hypothetical protein